MTVKWIKLSTLMFDDEKIKIIESMPDADTILIIWVKLLVQAGKTNASGYIYLSENIPYSDEMLATIFNRPLSSVRFALETFRQLGMVETEGNFISISNWEKHQNIDGMERIKEQNRLRKQRERERKASLPMSQDSHVTVTQSHATDIEEELDIDKERDKEKEEEQKCQSLSFFSTEFNVLPSPMMVEKVLKMVDEYTDNWTLKALETALMNNNRSLSYVEGILRKWKERGSDAPWDAKKPTQTKQSKPQIPTVQSAKGEEVSPERLAELQKLAEKLDNQPVPKIESEDWR